MVCVSFLLSINFTNLSILNASFCVGFICASIFWFVSVCVCAPNSHLVFVIVVCTRCRETWNGFVPISNASVSEFCAHLWNSCFGSLGAIYNAALQHTPKWCRIEFVENRKLISRPSTRPARWLAHDPVVRLFALVWCGMRVYSFFFLLWSRLWLRVCRLIMMIFHLISSRNDHLYVLYD